MPTEWYEDDGVRTAWRAEVGSACLALGNVDAQREIWPRGPGPFKFRNEAKEDLECVIDAFDDRDLYERHDSESLQHIFGAETLDELFLIGAMLNQVLKDIPFEWSDQLKQTRHPLWPEIVRRAAPVGLTLTEEFRDTGGSIGDMLARYYPLAG